MSEPAAPAAPVTPAAPIAAGAAPAAPTTAPEYWGREWVGADGSLNHKALERAGDDVKPLTADLSRYKTYDEFLKGHKNLAELAGRKALAPLPADAKPEAIAERNAILRAINGVPEKPEGYGIAKPADLPDIAWNQKAADAAAAVAHKHNISPAAMKDLLATQISSAQEQLQAQQQYEDNFFKEQDAAIKAAFTKDGVPYDKGMDLAKRTARTFGLDPENPIFKNAQVVTLLQKIGVAIGEPKLVTGEVSPTGGATNFSEQANSIIHDKTNPDNAAYWDGMHPKNREVKQKVIALMQAATNQKAAGGNR